MKTTKRHSPSPSPLPSDPETFSYLFDNHPLPMWIYDLGTLKFLAVNDAAVEKYGYSRDEFSSMTIKEIRPREDIPALMKNIERVGDGLDDAGVWRHKKKDGRLIQVRITSHALIFKGRKAELVIAVDITEQKNVEQDLRRSEEKFSIIFQKAPYAMVLSGFPDGAIEDVNEAFTSMLGYSRQEVIGKTSIQLGLYPDPGDRERTAEQFRREGCVHNAEVRIIARSGELRIVLIGSDVVVIDGTRHILTTIQDITERTRAEKTVRENEKRYRTIVENVSQAYYETDGRSRFTYCNPGLFYLSGYSMQELRSSSTFRLVAEEHREYVKETYVRWKAEKRTDMSLEFLVQTRNGKKFWVEQHTHFEFDEQGRLKRATNFLRDIDERKRSEEKLQLSEQTMKLFVEFAPAAIAMFDRDMKYIASSKRFIADYHLTVETVVGYSHYEIFPEITDRWKEIHRRCLAGAIEKADEDPFPRADGSLDWIRWEIRPWYASAGDIGGIILFSEVITERKKTAEALRVNEQKFRLIAENARDLIYRYRFTPERGFEYVSPSSTRITGYTPEEHYADPDLGFKLVHPDDRHLLEEAAKGSIDPDKSLIFRWVRKDGSIIWTEQRNIPVRDSQNNLVALEGIARDITERKKAEEELHLYAKRLEKAEMHAGLGSWEYIPHTNQRWWSKSLYYMLHFEPSVEVPEYEAFVDHVHPDDQALVIEAQSKMFQGIDIPAHEFRTNPKYGPVHVLSNVLHADTTNKEAPVMYRGTVLDITERKRAERQIVKLNRVYAVLSNINQAIVRVQDINVLFNEVCRIIMVDGKFLLAWIGMLDEDGHKIKVVASAGVPEPFIERLNIDLTDERWSNCPTGRSIKTGTHAISMDIQNDTLMEAWKETALAIGCNSSTAFPLKVFGKTVGSLNIYSHEVGYFDDDEIKLLAELASDISFALEFTHEEKKRKQAEESLAESELFFRAIWEHSASGIRLTDEHGTVINANDAYCRLVEKNKDEVVGRSLSEVYVEQDRERIVAKHTKNFYSKIVPTHIEKYLTLWNGKKVWFEVSNSFIDIMGKQTLLLGVFTDISERRRVEELHRESEQKYREVIENASEIIYTTDMRGNFTYVNPAGILKTGYSAEEFQKLNYLDLILPEHKPKVKKFYMRQFVQKLPTVQFHFPFVSKSGTVIWFEQNSTLLIEDGKITGLQFIARDITERRKIEDALSESTERFREMTENIREVFWLSDAVEKTMLYVSPAYESIWGQSRESLYTSVGDWLKAIHTEDHERITDAQAKQIAGTYDEMYRIVRPDGSIRWIHDRAYPVKDDRGNVYRIAGVAEDITEQQKNEESRKNLESQLLQAQKLESLGTLASGIAHDFNNILGIIIAHSSVLSKMAVTPELITKSAEAITKAGMRGAGLVKQMLTFARKTEVKFTSLRINETIIEASKLLNETFPKIITFSLQLENELPPIVADATQVHQVLLNLCVNARDAMPNGGMLTVTTRRQPGSMIRERQPNAVEDDYIVLSVKDTGSGMDEETKRRIFEPFFTTKELGKGTGLGLSLVFGIMETHDGFVEVESEIGEGTTFRCYFPVKREAGVSEQKSPSSEETGTGGTETILLVEDEDLLRNLLQQFLESKGYTVLTASDGEEGVTAYQNQQDKIKLVLSDIGLPKLGGIEMYQKIKIVDPNVRLVFASGYIEPGTKEKILNEGVHRFIQKPYDLNEVLSAVRSALDKK
ncbi:MAG: PAS domain S-box protein [Ignavibacteriales bacterium]|nr:PAS domain S-box protein [Ignavibacteriales bacterium]